MRTSFIESLQIKKLKALTRLHLFLRNIPPKAPLLIFLGDQKGLKSQDYAALCVKITNSTTISEVQLYVGKILRIFSYLVSIERTNIDNESLQVLTGNVQKMRRLTEFVILAAGTKVDVEEMRKFSNKLKELGLDGGGDHHDIRNKGIH